MAISFDSIKDACTACKREFASLQECQRYSERCGAKVPCSACSSIFRQIIDIVWSETLIKKKTIREVICGAEGGWDELLLAIGKLPADPANNKKVEAAPVLGYKQKQTIEERPSTSIVWAICSKDGCCKKASERYFGRCSYSHSNMTDYELKKAYGQCLIDGCWKVAVVTTGRCRRHAEGLWPLPPGLQIHPGVWQQKVFPTRFADQLGGLR